jgi:mycofactocin system glycosyltransferase
MLDRGFADPATPTTPVEVPDVIIVVPAMDHPENLKQLLASLAPQHALVVDDGSRVAGSVAGIAAEYGADIIVHDRNRGPAAARNTGIGATDSHVVAFVDSDCLADRGWPGSLLHHFADPAVAAVAPRVAPTLERGRVLERYETTRSSLDMGRRPELVRPGARLGFVPSACLLVRRTALGDSGFDEDLRLGEDVDLVWRMAEAGWLVRYDPGTVVRHRSRIRPREWLVRRYEYGTSAPGLEVRHPGLLAPARVSSWNLATLALIGAGQPILGVAVTAVATGMLWREVRNLPSAPLLAARTVGQGLLADGSAIGHLLRREWWPIGAVALALSPRSRTARIAVGCMLAPIAYEWATQRPLLDPIRYTALRLIDDAAYGTGVLAASGRQRGGRTLLPEIRWPRRGSPPAPTRAS